MRCLDFFCHGIHNYLRKYYLPSLCSFPSMSVSSSSSLSISVAGDFSSSAETLGDGLSWPCIGLPSLMLVLGRRLFSFAFILAMSAMFFFSFSIISLFISLFSLNISYLFRTSTIFFEASRSCLRSSRGLSIPTKKFSSSDLFLVAKQINLKVTRAQTGPCQHAQPSFQSLQFQYAKGQALNPHRFSSH